MTVESAQNKSGPFIASGTSGTFPRNFLVLDGAHVRVVRSRDGVEADITTGISHSGIGSARGTVTLTQGIQSGDRITLLRNVPNVQRSDYSAQSSVPTAQVELDIDLLTMQVQDLAERQSRALTLPVDSTYSGEAAMQAALDAPRYVLEAKEAADRASLIGNRIVLDSAIEVTVGAGGDFATVNAAIANLSTRTSRVYKASGVKGVVRLLSGFAMAEQVFARDGLDLGWITIASDEAEVAVIPSGISESLSTADAVRPIFGAIDGSRLPVIGALFAYASNLTAQDGIAVMHSSEVSILPGCGVKRARNGLKVLYGSKATCAVPGLTQGGDGAGGGTVRGADFSYAANRAVHIGYGSQANLPRSSLHHAGEIGVYCIWSSRGDFYQSDASYSGGWGFYCRDGSTLCCRETHASHCKRGYHALHQARIDARGRQDHPPTAMWVQDGAQYCTEYAVLASGCSQIEADELKADFCTGSAAIHASNGSTINFGYGSATGCTNRGVWAVDGGIVSAQRTKVGGSNIGYHAQTGGQITAESGNAVGCIAFGALAESGGRISARVATITGANRNVEARDGCEISVRDAVLTGATARGVSAIDGGRVNCMGANIGSSAVFPITARDGGHVSAANADCGSSGNVHVIGGGVVAFAGGTGAPSQTVNTISAAGVIYR